ncbi:MAG: hypothetical protein WBS22_13855 [Methylocystis sp.]
MKLGGASKLGLELRATVYLFYLAMCDLKERGIHYFNVGANIPSHRGTKWGTIGDFKRRFSTLRWDALVLERVMNRYDYWWRLIVPLALRTQVSESRHLRPVLDWMRAVRRRLRPRLL